MKDQSETQSASLSNWLKFIIPSALGVFLFLTPVPGADTLTIPFGVMIDWINANFATGLIWTLAAVTVISAVLSIWYSYGPATPDVPLLTTHFRAPPIWNGLRILGAVFAVLYVTKLGPEFITSGATGGTVIGTLMTNLLALFALASFGLPLLADYGFMEFIGALLSRAFRFLFRLPGRSAIDGMASWLGAAALGVMLTIQQYDKGIYTTREAATVATNFSIVSIPFCYVIAKLVGLSEVFFQYYASVLFIGLVCALVMSRIPPLSWLPDEPKPGTDAQVDDTVHEGESLLQAGTRLGLERARNAPNFLGLLRSGVNNLVFMWFSLVPATVAIAMITLILVEYTPLFQWLSIPLVPLLEFAGVAEAQAAAPSLVVGFADMYLPALIGKSIESPETRFLIAILSVSQLIYMSEVGAILLRANLRLNIGHLLMIFVIRTIIAAPLALIIAKFVF